MLNASLNSMETGITFNYPVTAIRNKFLVMSICQSESDATSLPTSLPQEQADKLKCFQL